METANIEDVRHLIRAADFGGASVTIPHKLSIIPLLDEVTPAAEIIGAVNTIINRNGRLVGDNTDWMGMTFSLINSAKSSSMIPVGSSGLVVGGGGTSRAAIYALHALSFKPIYIAGRTPAKLVDMIASFPATYDIRVLHSVEEAKSINPIIVVGTIPADRSMDAGLREIVTVSLKNAQPGVPRVLLEMAYNSSSTELMQVTSEAGFEMIVTGLVSTTIVGCGPFLLLRCLELTL